MVVAHRYGPFLNRVLDDLFGVDMKTMENLVRRIEVLVAPVNETVVLVTDFVQRSVSCFLASVCLSWNTSVFHSTN